MKSKNKTKWITAGLCFSTYSAWALIVARLIMYQGDNMIGFHPIILATFPVFIIGIISALISFICRRWQVGIALGLGSLFLFLIISNGLKLEMWAWHRTIILNARVNEEAMASIGGDLAGYDVQALWEADKLSRLEDFKWYGTNHFSAPDGVYFGFKIAGVPHVRIQKIRHGWKGIALIHSKSDIPTLKTRTGLKYSRVGSSDWYLWSTDV